jgi:hypothetical protein
MYDDCQNDNPQPKQSGDITPNQRSTYSIVCKVDSQVHI